MVIALLALSLVMIVGGSAAVVQGFPYVRLESGLAMVIGGTSAASAGAVLLGLTAIVARLKRVEEAFAQRDETAFSPAIAPLPASARPPAAGAAGLAGLTIGAAGLAPSQRAPEATGAEPQIESRADGTVEPAEALSVGPADRIAATLPADDEQPPLPDLLPAADRGSEPSVPTPQPAEQPEPRMEAGEPTPSTAPSEEDLFTEEEKAGDLGLRPSVDEASPAPDEEAAQDALQVVGTYSSGGNTYVMFSNGSIEADTPRGRFTFNSLDELKAFVEAGGEGDARGAA